MSKINWLILANSDRGTDYGVGTFIKQLAYGLSINPGISVYIIEIGKMKQTGFEIENKERITYIYITLPGNAKYIATNNKKNNSNLYQKKVARTIVRLIKGYLAISEKNVVHLNFVYQYFIGLEFKNQLNCKVIFTQHLFAFIPKEVQELDTEKDTFNLVDKLVTVTKHGKSHLFKKYKDSSKIKVIYNGIQPDCLKLRTTKDVLFNKYGLKKTERIILYSGRIDLIKGLEYLAQAFSILLKELPDCRLVIAGDGEIEELIQLTQSFSSQVSYLGYLPNTDMVGLYHIANIGVIPSLEEHCSYVALEMMHCGLPVVVSSVGGLKELFIHNKNALLCKMVKSKSKAHPILINEKSIQMINPFQKTPDVVSLAKAMIKLLKNKELQYEFSKKLESTSKKYTAKRMGQEYFELIRDLN
ncbi:MAG: glycosyltransferase [Bacteroidales bacterium]|nr:glycosyltransferase [Bacteroidales bacterium]